jgi:glucan biosynthesis protein C
MTAIPPALKSASPRRPDLDALRVSAFALLILYHLGMFYVPWGWHVKSTHITPGLEPWMGALNPWRLTLLFVISGAATRFMAQGLSMASLAARRSQRLLVPLLFGMLLVVPPQSWAQVVESHGYTGGFLDFWPRYLSFDQSFGIILPTYNHLWFVAYLWLYTVVAAAAARPLAPLADRVAGRLLVGPGLFVVPALVFGAYRASAYPAWGETLKIWADGYNHLQYGTAFLLGLVLAKRADAWETLRRLRLPALIAAAAMLAVALPLASHIENARDWRGIAFAFLREAYAWTTICALFGYANQWVRKGSPLLTRLSEAVFPAYIVHQTTIVVAGHMMKPLALPALVEAGLLFLLTVASCVAAYGLALAVPALRLPLGLRPLVRPASSS